MERVYEKDTYRPLPALARFTRFYHAEVDSTMYFSAGRFRQREEHCIFHYTIRGMGECFYGSRRYRTTPGVGFLHVINDPEAGYGYPNAGQSSWEFICLCYEGGNARDLTRELLMRYGPLYRIPTDALALPMFQEKFWADRQSQSNAQAAELFTRFLGALLRGAEPGPAEASPLAARAKALFDARHEENPGVAELATWLNVSREHLSRVFKEDTGEPLREYLTRQRLLRACRLLKEEQLSITEIAQRCGASSPSNFARAFKHALGMTPAQFRKQGVIPI